MARREDEHRGYEPMDIGLELLNVQGQSANPLDTLARYSLIQRENSARYFDPGPHPAEYERDGDVITYDSPIRTETLANNRALGRVFETRNRARAVVLLAHWNASAKSSDRLARLLRVAGIATFRLSLPYHDRRRPDSMKLARFMVSANLGRTIRSCRQSILEARLAINWLENRGYKQIGLIGSSLGSSIASIVAAHDDRVKAAALILTAGHFGETVWTGRATRHIRQALEGRLTLEQLQEIWSIISPISYVDRLHVSGVRMLVVSGRDDEVFPPILTERFVDALRAAGVPHHWQRFACGHYTMGTLPFSALALLAVTRFLRESL
jgi:pimeloyl-ACP methyl ester carboxylesterase